MNAGTDMYL